MDAEVLRKSFEAFIQDLPLPDPDTKEWLPVALDGYSVQEMGLDNFTIPDAKNIHQTIIAKYQNRNLKKIWCQTEIKLFLWMLCQREIVLKRKAAQFQEADWVFLTRCLPRKTVPDLKFQWRILSKTQSTDNWGEEELNLLQNIIIQQKLHNKWNDVSRQLFNASRQQFFRRPKQCREQWKNHLDPEIEKGEWSEEEDYQLLQLVLEIGKRWSSISKCIGSRTQHSVKNRFHSLTKQYSKLINKRDKGKGAGKKKDQQEELIQSILKKLRGRQTSDKQSLQSLKVKNNSHKEPQVKKGCPLPTQKQEPIGHMFVSAPTLPQSGFKQMFVREDLDNRMGYVYSPMTPYTAYLQKNKSMGNLLMINSPRMISPRFKMITRWEDLDNKQYFI